jgi:hypothetical protein
MIFFNFNGQMNWKGASCNGRDAPIPAVQVLTGYPVAFVLWPLYFDDLGTESSELARRPRLPHTQLKSATRIPARTFIRGFQTPSISSRRISSVNHWFSAVVNSLCAVASAAVLAAN